MSSHIVIIGASAAGVAAARTLRDEKFEGRITLVDADPLASYERPPLSKAALQQAHAPASDFALLSEDEASRLNVKTLYGVRCMALSADKQVVLDNGVTLSADKIVLATGGTARRLPIAGVNLPGVHVLRNLSDAHALQRDIDGIDSLAVIGGGLIGSEVVASLACNGMKVHWIDAAPKPLVHILPTAIVEPLLAWHCAMNVNLIVDARIESFQAGDDGRVSRVCFVDGSSVPVGVVVLGVGMTPDLSLADGANLQKANGGIAVNDRQQSSVSGIYAAGDVAAVRQADGQHIRHEHWQSAEHQGANAARSILGLEPLPYPVAWFWSDQANLHIEMAGHKGNRSVVRQAETDGWPTVFEFEDDTLVGAVSVNNPAAVRVAIRLIRAGGDISAAELENPSLDLRKLIRR